jgi:hypothetical protein
MSDEDEELPRKNGSPLSWYAVYEPDTFTLEEYHRLRAEADAEIPERRR